MRTLAAITALIAGLGTLSSGTSASTQESRPHRLVWHGHIEDQRFSVSRAVSGGGVRRMPTAFTFGYSISVDFEYVQEFAVDGSASWPKRTMSWTLEGQESDETQSEACHGGGRLDLGSSNDPQALSPEQRHALEASCERKTKVTNFRIYETLPRTPPMPRIPGITALDEGCAYRAVEGTRVTSIWLTPDVEAVVELDTKPGDSYARFVPEPGKAVEITVKTVPSFPALFRFVIDPEHTSHFEGYAGNATVKHDPNDYYSGAIGEFFLRYHLEHLSESYTDSSPDLVFDPRFYAGKGWKATGLDTVETTEELASATASVMAMDYGAIGKIKVFAKYKCGGWTPARIVVGGKPHDSVSVPLDDDGNLIADTLDDYRGDPGADDDVDPEGDGTKGDGLTVFEEYRGFMAAGSDCNDRLTDEHVRTSPKQKNLFVAFHESDTREPRRVVEAFREASGLAATNLCSNHLSVGLGLGLDGGYKGSPDETRIVNFSLPKARQTQFEGKTISLGKQHGVLVEEVSPYSDLLAGMTARAVPVTEGWTMGPPALTKLVVVNFRQTDDEKRFAVIHELGHVVGIPHHSDTRVGQDLKTGIENVIPEWSPLQAANISLQDKDAGAMLGSSPAPDLLLIAPGPACAPGDKAAAYRDGQFAGCLTFSIVRRGQQHSGPVSCPMRYQPADFYEPPGVKAVYGEFSGDVTDDPHSAPQASNAAGSAEGSAPSSGIDDRAFGPDLSRHTFNVDLWRGDLRRWPEGAPPASWGAGKFCDAIGGTDINAPEKPDNLAGDEGRKEGCRRYIVVNDLASAPSGGP